MCDFFEFGASQFIQHEGNNNGQRKADSQRRQIQNKCIFDCRPEVLICKNFFKYVQPDPGTFKHSLKYIVILKCDGNPIHRNIFKDDKIYDNGQKHQIYPFIIPRLNKCFSYLFPHQFSPFPYEIILYTFSINFYFSRIYLYILCNFSTFFLCIIYLFCTFDIQIISRLTLSGHGKTKDIL